MDIKLHPSIEAISPVRAAAGQSSRCVLMPARRSPTATAKKAAIVQSLLDTDIMHEDSSLGLHFAQASSKLRLYIFAVHNQSRACVRACVCPPRGQAFPRPGESTKATALLFQPTTYPVHSLYVQLRQSSLATPDHHACVWDPIYIASSWQPCCTSIRS